MPTSDLVIGAVRRDADTTTAADGGTHSLFTDEDGRLKVASKGASFEIVSQTITANGQSVPCDVSIASNVTIHVKGGAVAGVGGNFAFEGSVDSTDGINGTWFGIQAARTNANTVEAASGAIALGIGIGNSYAWEASVNAYAWIRVRAQALTSGQYAVTIVRGTYATEPAPAIQSHAISGSVAVTMAASTTSSPAKAEDAAHASGDVGVFALAVRNDNAATARSSANGDYDGISVDANGAAFVRNRPAPSSAVTSVAASASSVALLAANAARRGATIYNDSTAALYLKLGATASTTSFTIKLAADGYFEVPFDYSGAIDGIWASATGNARVTEVS